METGHITRPLAFLALMGVVLSAELADAQRVIPSWIPEQRTIQVRDPSQLPQYRMPETPAPPTVSNPQPELPAVNLSLDEAIRMALGNTRVVRVLTGTSAAASGRTVYDAAITNTAIDEQNARFDPTLSVTNTWNRLENPQGIFDPVIPGQSQIVGFRNDSFLSQTNLAQRTSTGGILGFGVDLNPSHIHPGPFPLNPQTQTSTNINYTQPLLQGGRIGANVAPIVIARIETERSYFQFKDSVQEQVRGVFEAYWALVAARTDVWARRQQVEQLTDAVRRIKARRENQFDNRADEAQAVLALTTFRATLITSQANMIQREAALRNLIGLPPSDGTRLVPITPPTQERFLPDWQQILGLAAERRPDIVELKLIIEADVQQIQIAKNNALPQLDAVAQYRWNGLEGVMPNGNSIRSPSGAYTDWTLGVNFSVPLGLRQSRAGLRRQELLIARDRINLQQGLHNAAHQLATNVRALDQAYEQYLAFHEARVAARVNLDYQLARYVTAQAILLNVLQAVTDWGNAITAEAGALTQYNTQLATLERQTGTILETHGIYFVEERFGAVGPLGHFCEDVCYPLEMLPTSNDDRYPVSDQPSEEAFELKPPRNLRDKLPGIPYEDIQLPPLDDLMPAEPTPAVSPRLPAPTPPAPPSPTLRDQPPSSLPVPSPSEPEAEPQPIRPAGYEEPAHHLPGFSTIAAPQRSAASPPVFRRPKSWFGGRTAK